jgi:hypothetical protein
MTKGRDMTETRMRKMSRRFPGIGMAALPAGAMAVDDHGDLLVAAQREAAL